MTGFLAWGGCPSIAPAACEQNIYHLTVSGTASGYIEFYKFLCDDGMGQLWYENFSVTGDGGGPYSGADFVLPFATHSPPIKFFPPEVGQTWTDSGTSNGYPVESSSVVISVTETVAVAAGTFANCVLAEETLTYPSGYALGQNPPVFYRRWLAPGVGPVKLIIGQMDGSELHGELLAYHDITSSPDDCFPLGTNATWTAEVSGRNATWNVDWSELQAGWIPDGTFGPGAPLTVSRESNGDVTLSWSPSCVSSDDDYEIYEGPSPTGYTRRFCTTGGATTKTFTPLAGTRFYVIVPRNGQREGSYGTDSNGYERPQGVSSCLSQAIGWCE